MTDLLALGQWKNIWVSSLQGAVSGLTKAHNSLIFFSILLISTGFGSRNYNYFGISVLLHSISSSNSKSMHII